jgi:hypothetical protein
MTGNEKFHDELPCLQDPVTVGMHHHTINCRGRTGRHQVAHPINLNDTQAASAGGRKVGDMAKGRDTKPVHPCDLKDRLAILALTSLSINYNLHKNPSFLLA